MKMDAENQNNFLLPVFVDASGEAYYDQGQVAKKLLKYVQQSYPLLFRRRATPEEMPTLISLGMKPRSQKGERVLTLVKVEEIHDLLECRREKYEALQRSKKLLFGAGSSTTTPTSEGSTRPPFTHVQLISQALVNSESNDGLSLREIANWISHKYPYYQSTKSWLSKVSKILSASEFFIVKKRYMKWQFVPEYETRLRQNAYLSKTVLEKKQRRKRRTTKEESSTTFQSLRPSGSKLVEQALESTVESSEVDCVASYPMNTTIHTIAEQKNRPVQTETSISRQMNEDVKNGAYISLPREIKKQEVSVDDIIDLTNDELDEDQSIDTKHQPEWKINPTTCPITTETLKGALQSVAPSLFNGNREAAIFVFSGNVYLSSSNPPATS